MKDTNPKHYLVENKMHTHFKPIYQQHARNYKCKPKTVTRTSWQVMIFQAARYFTTTCRCWRHFLAYVRICVRIIWIIVHVGARMSVSVSTCAPLRLGVCVCVCVWIELSFLSRTGAPINSPSFFLSFYFYLFLPTALNSHLLIIHTFKECVYVYVTTCLLD